MSITNSGGDVPAYYTCTWDCVKKFMEPDQVFTNPMPYEIEGLRAASEKGGAYIETIKKPNLSTWSTEEWELFIKTVVCSFQNQVRDSIFADETIL